MNTLARTCRTAGLGAALLLSAHAALSAPTTSFSRILFGNSSEHATAQAVDVNGYTYVTGITSSTYSFPAGTGAATTHGYKDCTLNYQCPTSAFIVKIDPSGNIVAQVLFGGSGSTSPMAIAVDGSYVYVAGATNSPAITTAAGRYPYVAYNYGATPSGTAARSFQAKFSLGLDTLTTVTTIGAKVSSEVHGIAVDSGGSTYLTGQTCGGGAPVTNFIKFEEAYTEPSCEVFVAHLDYLGSFSGVGPKYFTQFGSYQSDVGNAIVVDSGGAAWVAGRACTAHFPVTAGLSHGSPDSNHCTPFVMKLDPSGSTFQYSTTFSGTRSDYYGTNWREEATAITLNGSSGVYVGGFTEANDFPTMAAAAGHTPLQATSACNMTRIPPYCSRAGFVAYLDAGLNLRAATYLGGTNISQVSGIAKNSNGDVYVSGSISGNSAGFPATYTTNFVATGGYMTKLSGSLETVGWTILFSGPVTGILTKSNFTTTSLWTTGDTYPNTSQSDAFAIKFTESAKTGGVCRTCVTGR